MNCVLEMEEVSWRFASAAGFPIKAKEKVIGVLHLANIEKRHFAPDELQLIESIAQEIGVARRKCQTFRAGKSKNCGAWEDKPGATGGQPCQV